MKASSVSLILGLAVLLFGPTVSAASLDARPNRQLYFTRESVSLSCVEDGQTLDGWTVKRTAGGRTQTCGGGQEDFGSIVGSSCIVPQLSLPDSGVYWCESRAGQRSVQVNISVTDYSVMLELPKLPVFMGSDVTLRCRTRDGSTQTAYFHKNDSYIGYGDAGEFTISDVQQSDEGFYRCSSGLLSWSARRWLSVTDSPPPPPPSPPPPPPSLSVIRLLCHLVVAFPYCISTVLMVSVCCGKRTGNKPAVSKELDPRAEGGQGLAEEDDYVSEHDF